MNFIFLKTFFQISLIFNLQMSDIYELIDVMRMSISKTLLVKAKVVDMILLNQWHMY